MICANLMFRDWVVSFLTTVTVYLPRSKMKEGLFWLRAGGNNPSWQEKV